MYTSKYSGYTEAMNSALELWLLTRLQEYVCKERLLVPTEVDLSNVWRIVDVACGSGQWVRDMATWSPTMTVVGVDRQEEVMGRARRLAALGQLDNAEFVAEDMYHMETLKDRSFDLVHARFLAPVVAPHLWPALLQECLRVCHVGGTLVWTEAGFPRTNSAACLRWCDWMKQAIIRLGYTSDVTPYMHRLLGDVDGVDYTRVRRVETVLDIGVDTPLHTQIYRHISSLLDEMKPLLLTMDVAEKHELDEVCRCINRDIYGNMFQGTWTLTTMLVEKV